LPDDLLKQNVQHRALYLDRGDIERSRVAPQLVGLGSIDGDNKAEDRKHRLDQILAIVGDRPAVVFWQSNADLESFFHHLRTINMVKMPKASAFEQGHSYEANPMPRTEPESVELADATHGIVLFRHADANVMAQVLPALDAPQFSRLLGSSTQISFAPDGELGGRWMTAPRPADLPPPPSGLLKLDASTIKTIEQRRLDALRVRRANYLLETCKEETTGALPEALAEHIRVSEETGKELGLVTEGALCRWAFIMCKTKGRVLHDKEAVDFIRRGGTSPDDQVQQFMPGMAAHLQSRSAGAARS
jgi:hypothetical protein